MLAEKFFLYLEALIKNQQSPTHTDGSPRVISSSPHVPVKLVERTCPEPGLPALRL